MNYEFKIITFTDDAQFSLSLANECNKYGFSLSFIDNLYFYRAASGPSFDDGLLTNGDFEAGSDPWIIGVDDNTPAPVVTNNGNTYYSVDVLSAGNVYDVNMK